MNEIYRMVIDLYRQTFTDYVKSNQVNNDRILEVQTIIENSLTRARIEGKDTEILEHLKRDIQYLKYELL